LPIGGDDVGGGVFIDANYSVVERKFGTGRFRVGLQRLDKGQGVYD
jgi:hypothetical protein